MIERFVCVIIGYLCGLFQTSYLYGRTKGIDIREHGSGNAGTTNALRILGPKAGAITFLGDCLKCVVAVWISNLLFGDSHPEMIRLLNLYAAAGTILGHNYPFYLHFHGGKGIAATAGLIIVTDWRLVIVAGVLFLAIVITTKYVSLGSLLVYITFVIGLVILGQTGQLGLDSARLTEMYIIAFLLTVLAFYKHRANIVRLIHGNENKTYLFKKRNKKGDS